MTSSSLNPKLWNYCNIPKVEAASRHLSPSKRQDAASTWVQFKPMSGQRKSGLQGRGSILLPHEGAGSSPSFDKTLTRV